MSKSTCFSAVPVVIPSLDPDEKLSAVVEGLLQEGFRDIVLVNDGSKESHRHYFEEIVAAHPDTVTLLTHAVNRGKGAAMKTAFRYLLENRPGLPGVVTVDGDNQHRPDDTRACVEAMLQSGHTVLGVRDFSQPDVPSRSRMGNRITVFVFRAFCGIRISDTQTGLRALPADTLPVLLTVKGDRYEYETNTLLAMQEQHLPFEEVPITTVYIEDNQSSHFHVIKDSFRIYQLLLGHFFKFTASSLLCAMADTVLYALLSRLLHPLLAATLLTAVCTAGARICSSLLNFFLNQRLVFKAQGDKKAIFRYYALAIPQMFAQFLLTEGSYRLFRIPVDATGLRTLLYLAVMLILFFVSYRIQKLWVFQKKKDQNG